jgi:hypothetical protein
MATAPVSLASRFSLVWAAVLTVITMLEWGGLDREPLKEQILSPFIERTITLQPRGASQPGDVQVNNAPQPPDTGAPLEYHVDFGFNGPLFALYMFAPIVVIHGIGLLAGKLRKT